MAIPQRIGKYEIRKKLGEGATSIVYLGFDPFAEREVAVKAIFPEILRDKNRGQIYRHLFMTERPLTPEAQANKPPEDAYALLLATVEAALAAGDLHPSWADRPHHVAQTLWSTMHGMVALRMTLPPKLDVPMIEPAELAPVAMEAMIAGFRQPSV